MKPTLLLAFLALGGTLGTWPAIAQNCLPNGTMICSERGAPKNEACDTSHIANQTICIQMTDGKGKWWELMAVPHRTTDKAWWISNIIQTSSMIGDVELSLHELNTHPGAYEVNPLFGKRPSRARYYAIEGPLTGIAIWSSHHYKRESDALRGAGYPDHKYAKWHLLNDIITAEHLVSIGITVK